MSLSRRHLLTRSAALAALSAVEPGVEQTVEASQAPMEPKAVTLPSATLHGYGRHTAAFAVGRSGRWSVTTILCETSQKALLFQAKYLSDLERLPGVRRGSGSSAGRPISCYLVANGGFLACHAENLTVHILAAVDAPALTECLQAALPHAAGQSFTPRVPVPMYLDRWDRHGLLIYFSPETIRPGLPGGGRSFDYGEGLEFLRDHGGLGLILWTNPLTDDTAEGITNETAWSWVANNARKMGLPVHINTQISPPQLWLSNRYREQTMLKAPQFVGGYYGVAHDSAGVGAISWLAQEAEDALLGTFQEIVRRFAKDPNIVGWLEPHGETAEMPQRFFLDAGPYAEEVWRQFLLTRYGSLKALGARWHGNSAAYRDWNEVPLPEIAHLVGFGRDAIDLQGVWRVRYLPAPDGHTYTRDEARGLPSPPPTAPIPTEWLKPDFDDSGWDELIAPGNDRMLFMPRSPLVYRRTIEIPTDWLPANERVTLVLWDLIHHEHDVTTLHTNGQPITEQGHKGNEQHWSQFDVTAALKPGSNRIVLQMPRAIIAYRLYLTRQPVRQYPHLTPTQNAQWADLVAWNIETRGAQIRRGAEMIRQIDPDRSINFMAANDYFDPVKQACRDYGGRFHDTGAMAGFWTDWNSLMMSGAGLPVTAEPGNGAPNARDFQLFWGRWLTEAVNGVHYFQSWGEIAWNPEVLKVFEANLPMYRMIGKYHAPFAEVAVLYSSQDEWLTGFPWTPEPGDQGGYYSGYNPAHALLEHCPRDGVGAVDFGTPAVDRFRVIVDSNSMFMDETLIAGIEKYVRQGGVFITYGQTGRHDPVRPDSWPISRLTGYDVVDMKGLSYLPVPGNTVFGTHYEEDPKRPPLRRTANADDTFGRRSRGMHLKKRAPECQDLLKWEDGSTAVGMRPLGKGWIVHVGAMDTGDAFLPMLRRLLLHFGVTSRVPATVTHAPGLHFRHFIGNTGLHDVWVLFNESDRPLTTDLVFLGIHPNDLIDVLTGQKVEITHAPEGDAVRGIALAPWQTQMLLSPRADVMRSPLEWLTLQRAWWQGTQKPPNRRLPAPAEMQRFTVDLTADWRCKTISGSTDEQAAALTRKEVDDTIWERRRLALWLTPHDNTAKRLLLRRKFTVPAHWKSGQIALCADVPISQFFDETRLFVDGVPWANGRKSVDGPYDDTFDGLFQPGTTHLLALDIQSSGSLTGSRGPLWLTYLPDPQARQNLAGTWTAYADPLKRLGEAALPGKAKAMILTRTVVIDPAQKGRNIVLHFEATGDRFAIMVNGCLLNAAGQFRAHTFSFHITPMVRPGEENRIELVGNGLSEKQIARVEIRFYDKGVYP